MQYLGIDWSYRRAAWCALSERGAMVGEGAVPADEDGLATLVLELGREVRAVVEMMSAAIWCPSCGSRRWRTASCASGCAGGCVWSGMRASAMNRIFGLLTQWGLRLSLKRLRAPDAMALLEQRGVPEVWRPSNPWHPLYSDIAGRAGKNPVKSAVARKVLIAAGMSSRASNPSSPPRRDGPILPRQAPAAFWPPDGPAWN